KNVLAALDDVAEARVVDDDGVQSLDVERALSGGGHRQEIRLRFLALQKRPDNSDRLAAVIERAIYPRKPVFDQLRRLFYASARQSSSSAEVWWISSTTRVSVGRMSPS